MFSRICLLWRVPSPTRAVCLGSYLVTEPLKLTLCSASFSPFAARTQQYVKEQLGQAEDKVGQITQSQAGLQLIRGSLPDPTSSRLY